jgi:alpha,alpha-trehalase
MMQITPIQVFFTWGGVVFCYLCLGKGGYMQAFERQPLRVPEAVEPINPLDYVTNPGVMAPLYRAVRWHPDNPEGYKDGFALANAIPRLPYAEIQARYAQQSGSRDFSPLKFWDEHFITPTPNLEHYKAPEGMSIDEYTLTMRALLVYKAPEDSTNPLDVPFECPIPGVRFVNLFAWDLYHAMLGFKADGDSPRMLNVVDGMRHLIDRVGYVPNFNGVGVSRPQPPYFPRAVRMVAAEYGPEALVHYLEPLEKEYTYWMTGNRVVQLPDGALLNRYWDDADGPRLESYKEDVELGEIVAHGLTGEARRRRLAKFYKDMRAGAASGWDYSARWFADGQTLATICTTDILPVDLSCLLACSEETLAIAHMTAGNHAKAYQYFRRLDARGRAINAHHWDPEMGVYRDKNWVTGEQTKVLSAAMGYALYAGVSDRQQSMRVLDWFRRTDFLTPGGISTTDADTIERWDGRKNIWFPTNWATARGMVRQGHEFGGDEGKQLLEFGQEVQAAYLDAKGKEYDLHRMVYEKHDGDNPTRIYDGGEYPNQPLGMSIEGRYALQQWSPDDPDDCMPLARLIRQ